MVRSYTLGLDLGSNSAGWAVVFDEPKGEEGNMVLGTRIFPEGTERTKSGEEPRNLQRREARSARRLLDRRSRRKRKLRSVFKRAGAFPEGREAQGALLALDPYELRARGLDEALEPGEFARAILHLGQRRGFKSNLKAQGDQAKEEKGIKAEITDLGKTIADAGARTLGEYLWGLKKEYDKERDREARGEDAPECKRVRDRYTGRQMYVDEFNALWEAQAKHRPDLWTDALREEVYETIFFQRPLKSQSHLIGKCELEPEEPRGARASWLAQQVRMLQEVNNFGSGDSILNTALLPCGSNGILRAWPDSLVLSPPAIRTTLPSAAIAASRPSSAATTTAPMSTCSPGGRRRTRCACGAGA